MFLAGTYDNGVRSLVQQRQKNIFLFSIHKRCCTFRHVQFYSANQCHTLSEKEICWFTKCKIIIICPLERVVSSKSQFLCVRLFI